MRKVTVFVAIVLLGVFGVSHFADAKSVWGKIKSVEGISCSSGVIFSTDKDGSYFWASTNKGVSSNRKILGVSRTTNSGICKKDDQDVTVNVVSVYGTAK